MKNKLIALLVLFTVIFFSSAEAQTTARKFEAGKNTFLLDGKPFVVKAAELHYTRIPQAYWDHRIEMCKALGMNTICIYAFWNIHEQRPGEFNFDGQNDLARFCRLAAFSRSSKSPRSSIRTPEASTFASGYSA